MESKELFRLYNRKFYLANWFDSDWKVAQNEGDICWTYCGTNDDFKHDLVKQYINRLFSDDEIYLCVSPKISMRVPKSTADIEIRKSIRKKEIGLMDTSCTKIMFFSSGVFECGIIRDYPKNQERPAGSPLMVEFHANIVDSKTNRIADALDDNFAPLEKALNKDYGGAMEHLWIDVELVERDSEPWPFRFQKRVDAGASFNEVYSYNVGHYSIRPDFAKLLTISTEKEICGYIFELLYQSTQFLEDKRKKLGGFDAAAFQDDFWKACNDMGYRFPRIHASGK